MTPPPLLDTHAHLCDDRFDADRPALLAEARLAGVAAILAVGETLADARRNLELAVEHPMLRPAAGLYPGFPDLEQAEAIADLLRRERERFWAVGEVGLDYWLFHGEAEREVQREIFRRFIRLARELELPLNVHSRAAGRHALALLLEEGATRVQMHAFDAKAAAALPGIEAGHFFSVPPSVVRSPQKQKLVRLLPLERLLLETDAPVLGPEPGERNVPANLAGVVEAVAELKGVPPEAVRQAAWENTLRLYGTDFPAGRPPPG